MDMINRKLLQKALERLERQPKLKFKPVLGFKLWEYAEYMFGKDFVKERFIKAERIPEKSK